MSKSANGQMGKSTRRSRRRAKPAKQEALEETSGVVEAQPDVSGTTEEPFTRGREQDQLYTLGEWGGFTQWQCRLCPWDTLEGEREMLAHIAAVHSPRKKTQTLPLVDSKGNPLTIET